MRAHVVGLILCVVFSATSCKEIQLSKPSPRLSMFIGVDVSGSFAGGRYYTGAIEFLAHYIYSHLKGYGGLEVPNALFVGSIGGSKSGEAKTMYPIQTFQGKSVKQIHSKLKSIFPKRHKNEITDFNSFFKQVATTVQNKKLVLRPISVVMMSDGKPVLKKGSKQSKYRSIDLSPLEKLARNVTVRLLYTDAITGQGWQTEVPRKRVKVWTQDAVVMKSWKDSNIYDKKLPLSKQKKFFAWVLDNVDFGVRARRVD